MSDSVKFYKVIINDQVIMDVSDTTALPPDVSQGAKFYTSNGILAQGADTTTEAVVKEKVIDKNGIYIASLEGVDGFSKVTVNVLTTIPVLEELTATANGEYTPSGDGFSKVVVAVPEVTAEEVTITPTKERQEVVPTTADYISKTTVEPIPDEYVIPSGEITLNTNGEHDVSGKKTAIVSVPIPALEGTAIPVGKPVERIYFNTNLTIEEVNAYLSQLTYVQTELVELPVYIAYAGGDIGTTGIAIMKFDENRYDILIAKVGSANSANDGAFGIYWGTTDPNRDSKGWFGDSGFIVGVPISTNGLRTEHLTPLTDFNGLPIGLENDKIKNVMSITPFVAEGSDNYKLFGQWKFKAELPVPSEDIIQEINFTSAGLNFNKMKITYASDGTYVYYYKEDTGEEIEVYSSDKTPCWNTNYQEVGYGTTPQSVSKAYYDYVMANAEFVIVSEWDGSYTKTTD